MNDPKIPLSAVYKLFKKFIKEHVHGSDYDQGQSMNDTMSVFKKWWVGRERILKQKYKNKQ